MKCPIDGSQLVMTDRSGVEIDYCPQCRGVWLDRGELDKIIERNAVPPAPARQERGRDHKDTRDHDDRRDHDYRRYDGDHKSGRKRGVSSFLDDLFDF